MLVYSLRIHWDNAVQSLSTLTGEEAASLLRQHIHANSAQFDVPMLDAIFKQENDDLPGDPTWDTMLTNCSMFTAQLKSAISTAQNNSFDVNTIFTDTGEDEETGDHYVRRSVFWELKPTTKTWPLYYVGIFEESRLYGGPEEGGWWYSYYTPVDASMHMNFFRIAPAIFTNIREAVELREKMDKAIDDIGRPRWGDPRYVAIVQDAEDGTFGECFPKQRPRYE